LRVINLKDEAKKLSVPVGVVEKAFRKSLDAGKINGLFDNLNGEFVRYELKEENDLSLLLSSEKAPINKLAAALKIRESHVRLILNTLQSQGKIVGVVASDGIFFPETILQRELVEAVEKSNQLDIMDLCSQLHVAENEIQNVIKSMTKKIRNAVLSYSQIGIDDLSQEVGFSASFTLILLKKLVRDGTIEGKLDMVNKCLVIGGVSASAIPGNETTTQLEKKHQLLVNERNQKILESSRLRELVNMASINAAAQAIFGNQISGPTASGIAVNTASNYQNRISVLQQEIRQLNFEIETIETELKKRKNQTEE
jgi:hypothetical protein